MRTVPIDMIMENKKDKVALNDELLEKVAGGVLNVPNDDYLVHIDLDGPEPVPVFWYRCDRCHNEFRSDVDYVCVSPCCGAGCTLVRITHEYI